MLRVGVAVVLVLAGCDRFLQLQEVAQPPKPDAPPPPSSWASASAGYYHTCGIREDQSLWCWGRNDHSQLGVPPSMLGESAPPVAIGSDTWLAVSAGEHHACAIRTTGTLACWGNNGDGALGTGDYTTINGLSPIAGAWASVATGATFSCGIDTAGAMECWGNNTRGELGNTTTVGPSIPVPVPGGPWASVAAGGQHACAIDVSGNLFCWGNNGYGECGSAIDGAPAPLHRVPYSEPFMKVAAGDEFTCALTVSGHLRCFGQDTYGELGNGSHSGGPTLQAVGTDSSGWADIAAGNHHACALDQMGGLWCWGDNQYGALASTTVGFDLSTLPLMVSGGSGSWSGLALGSHHTCAIASSDHRMWCAGLAGGGQLGTLGSHPTPTQITGAWTAAAPGAQITCAIDGATHMSCWGDNRAGAIGDGTTTPRQVPTAVSGNQLWSGVAAGDHVCGLDSSNIAYCWGPNSKRQLGDGTSTDRSTPMKTALNNTQLAHVSAENDSTCVLQGTTPMCWGENYYGQCGTTTDPQAPQSIGISAKAIAAGDRMTCALPGSGAGIWCWGEGESLGTGMGTTAIPAQIPSLSSITFDELVAGDGHACARSGGRLWCWGVNQHGEVGNQDNVTAYAPFEHTGRTWAAIGAGGEHTCAIEGAGRLYCWGANDSGQLGDGTTVDRAQPTLIGSESAWSRLALGHDHTCAFKTDGSLWCWGGNLYGQIGDGTAWRADLQVVP